MRPLVSLSHIDTKHSSNATAKRVSYSLLRKKKPDTVRPEIDKDFLLL